MTEIQQQEQQQTKEIQFDIVKGSSTQYSITSTLDTINICITQYSDDKTMMICVTDSGCCTKWVVSSRTLTDIRFGKTMNVDPFATSLGRLLMGHLGGVDQLILGVGIKQTSREKLLMIVDHIKIVLAKAWLKIKEESQKKRVYEDGFDDDF